MPGTKVYTLGALPAGMPMPGGPVQFIDAPYAQPECRQNLAPQVPTSWDVPQNLLRPTWKGRTPGMSSTGLPITSALAGIGATDAEVAQQAITTLDVTRWSLSLLGATFAGMHGYRRNGGKTLPTVGWAAAGFILPLLTNVVAIAQGFGKRK